MENPPPFKMVEEPPKRTRGVIYMVLAGPLALLALVGLLMTVNAVLYLVGAGTEVEVTVTQSSTDSSRGRSSDGSGYYYTPDGEIVDVDLSYVEKGEKLTTRLPVIPLPLFGNPVLSGEKSAYEDLGLAIGAFGIGSVSMFLFLRGRGHYTGAIRLTRRYFLQKRPMETRNGDVR